MSYALKVVHILHLLTDWLHMISRYVRYQASPVSPDPSPNDYYYGQRVEQPTASAESSSNSAQPSSSSSSFERPQPTYDPTYRYKREAKQPFSHLAWSHWHICRQKVQGKTFYFEHIKTYEKREAIRSDNLSCIFKVLLTQSEGNSGLVLI